MIASRRQFLLMRATWPKIISFYLPLLAFLPALYPVIKGQSTLDFFIYFFSLFFVLSIALAATLKPILRINSIFMIIYQNRKGNSSTIYLSDIDYLFSEKRGIVVKTKIGSSILLPKMSGYNKALLASFLASENIITEFGFENKNRFDWFSDLL